MAGGKIPTEAFLLSMSPEKDQVLVEVYYDAITPHRGIVQAVNNILRDTDKIPGGRWTRKLVSTTQIDPGPAKKGVGYHAVYEFNQKKR